MEFKYYVFEMQTYIAQRVDKKKGLIRLVMFILRVMNNKMSKMAYVISAEYSKKLVPVWTRCLGASERSYLALSECTMDYGVLNYH